MSKKVRGKLSVMETVVGVCSERSCAWYKRCILSAYYSGVKKFYNPEMRGKVEPSVDDLENFARMKVSKVKFKQRPSFNGILATPKMTCISYKRGKGL